MKTDRLARGRWLLPALCAVLFLVVFLAAFAATVSPDIALSQLRATLERRGITLEGGRARLVFPASLVVESPSIRIGGGPSLDLDAVEAGWEPAGLFTRLPGHFRIKRKSTSLELRTSFFPWNPSRLALTIENLRSEDLEPFFPLGGRTGFAVRRAEISWRRGGALAAGTGRAALDSLRILIPSADSPVSEAVLTNLSLRLAVRGEDLHVTSLEGRYEDSVVDGTGVIARFLTPSRATITFHLRIHNFLGGKVAALFDMLAKNSRNANLRITGALLSPKGEFQFF